MKAAVVEKPGRLVVRDIPQPEPNDYEALCRTLCGATCTATDYHIIMGGTLPYPIPYPTILGHESIGRVVAVGRKVRNLKEGDVITRVGVLPCRLPGLSAVFGGFAEFTLAGDYRAMRQDGLPLERWDLARRNQILPDDFSPPASTMIITWRESLSYIRRAGVKRGSSLLIIGSGGTGLSFACHARNLGASRILMIGHPDRAGIARTLGATLFNYKAVDVTQQVAAEADDGFDCIIDCIGKADSLNPLLPLLRCGGTAGIYGVSDWGRIGIDPNRCRGAFTCLPCDYYDEEEVHDEVVSLIRSGALDASHWLDWRRPCPLTDIAEVYERLQRREMIKAVIEISPP